MKNDLPPWPIFMMMTRSNKRVPFSFVIEELDSLDPIVKPMFGCFSIYIGDKIVLFLCEREKRPYQKGVWVATTPEYYKSLAQEFSSTRSVENPKIGKSPWLLLPAGAEDFEEQALRACELIMSGDPRIGRAPKPKRLKPTGNLKFAIRDPR